MKLNEDVRDFGRICEHLLFSVYSAQRPLTNEELLFVKYYCRELLDILNGVTIDGNRKPAPPPPPAPTSVSSD